jgi:hypothetical protein
LRMRGEGGAVIPLFGPPYAALRYWTFNWRYTTVAPWATCIGQPYNPLIIKLMIELTISYLIATAILVIYGAQV